MKFSDEMISERIPEWRDAYINYLSLNYHVELILSAYPLQSNNEEQTVVKDRKEIRRKLILISPLYTDFFVIFIKELERSDNFYQDRLNILTVQFAATVKQVQFVAVHPNSLVEIKTTPLAKFVLWMTILFSKKKRQQIVMQRELYSQTNTVKKIVLELYRSLHLLMAFQALNIKATKKIIKKFVKATSFPIAPEFSVSITAKYGLLRENDALIRMAEQVESLFAETYTFGNRREGMKQLRITEAVWWSKSNHQALPFRVGCLLGVNISLAILFATSIYATNQYSDISFQKIVKSVRGLFLFAFFPVLISINMFVWNKYKINYVFIFNLNYRNHVLPYNLLELGLTLMLAWFLAVLVYAYSQLIYIFPSTYTPLAITCAYFVIIMNPLLTTLHDGRKWFLKRLLKIICAPFFFVNFEDFWLADQLCSLTYMFSSLQYMVCFLSYDKNNVAKGECNMTSVVVSALCSALPFLFRLLQTCRRFYDSKLNIHIPNIIKYFLSILTVITSTIAAALQTNGNMHVPSFVAWVIFATLSMICSYLWDIIMDFGLFNKKTSPNRFLRENLIYPSWVYYAIIVGNALGRMLWVITLSFSFTSTFKLFSESVLFLLSVIEITRRFFWNFFRLEYEFTHNREAYRATKDITLPFLPDHVDEATTD